MMNDASIRATCWRLVVRSGAGAVPGQCGRGAQEGGRRRQLADHQPACGMLHGIRRITHNPHSFPAGSVVDAGVAYYCCCCCSTGRILISGGAPPLGGEEGGAAAGPPAAHY